MIKILFINLM